MFHPNLCTVKIPQTLREIEDLVYKGMHSEYTYFDTETSGVKVRAKGHDYMIGLAIGFDDEVDDNVYYIPVNHFFEGKDQYSLDARINEVKKLFSTPENPNEWEMLFPYFTKELLDHSYYNLPEKAVMQLFKKVFEKSKTKFVAHNIMFDLHVLQNSGIDVSKTTGIIDVNKSYDKLYDTLIARHLIDQDSPKKLEYVCKELFGVHKLELPDINKTLLKEEKLKYNIISGKSNDKENKKVVYPSQYIQIPIMGQYSGEDVFMLKPMKQTFDTLLEKEGLTNAFYQLRMPYVPSVWNMERAGLPYDFEEAKRMITKADKELEDLLYIMYESAGKKIKVGSDQQIYELLFGFKKKLAVKEKDSVTGKSIPTGKYKESFNADIIDISFGFKYDPQKMTDGGAKKIKELKVPQVSQEALDELVNIEPKNDRQREGIEFIKALQKHKLIEKLRSTYMIGQSELVYSDGRIHPSFNITGTISGRLSCSEPNLQNLPRALEYPQPIEEGATEYEIKEHNAEMEAYNYWHQFEIRRLYHAPSDDHCLLSADYSALERRISAHFSQDKNLIDMILKGYDMHGFVATLIFGDSQLKGIHHSKVKKLFPHLRNLAKTVGFAVDYQGTSYAVAKDLKCEQEEAQFYIDKYWEGFSGLKSHADKQISFARKYGFVYTLLGRKKFFPDINNERNVRMRSKGILSKSDRLAVNAPVQGTAADIMMKAQIILDNDPLIRATKTTIPLQVHDELVFIMLKKYMEVLARRIRYAMANCLPEPLTIPLKAETDYGRTYAEAK